MRQDAERTAQRETGRRRRFTQEFRRQVVQETLAPGVSVAGVALQHRLNANQVFTWRRKLLPALARLPHKGEREGARVMRKKSKRAAQLERALWEDNVRHARAGDIEAARDILRDVAESVENIAPFREPEKARGGPIPWWYAEYLAQAFRQILNGVAPEKALNLVGKKRGRRKGKSVTHDLEAVAAAFHLLIRKQSLPDGLIVGGLKPEQANGELQRALGVDRATVYRARRQNQAFQYPKWIDDEILKVVAKPYAARITAILEKTKRTRRTKTR